MIDVCGLCRGDRRLGHLVAVAGGDEAVRAVAPNTAWPAGAPGRRIAVSVCCPITALRQRNIVGDPGAFDWLGPQ